LLRTTEAVAGEVASFYADESGLSIVAKEIRLPTSQYSVSPLQYTEITAAETAKAWDSLYSNY
jgi:hypothetical protein